MSAVVAGVDPSISSTGVAVLGPLTCATLRIQSKPGGQDLAHQLARMRHQVIAVHAAVEEVTPSLIVMEGPAYGSPNQMGHMLAGFWWLLAHALEKVAPIAVVQPSTLKKYATGNGRASKDEMVAAAVRGFSQVRIKGNDEADALALAAMGADRFGLLYAGGFESVHQGSIASVRWPEIRNGAGQ